MGSERLLSGLMAQDLLADDATANPANRCQRQQCAFSYAPLSGQSAMLVPKEREEPHQIDSDGVTDNRKKRVRELHFVVLSLDETLDQNTLICCCDLNAGLNK